MEVCCTENIQDTNSPHTPIFTSNEKKTPNDGSITRSYKRRLQELRPRRYSQKFIEIRCVFEKNKQSPKSPDARRLASITLGSKLKRETLNRFELTGSPQRYTLRQRARSRSLLAQMEGMSNASTPVGRTKRASEMHSSLYGSLHKVSWILGGDDDNDESQDNVGGLSILLNESERCCLNVLDRKYEQEMQEQDNVESRQDPKQTQKSKQGEESKQWQEVKQGQGTKQGQEAKQDEESTQDQESMQNPRNDTQQCANQDQEPQPENQQAPIAFQHQSDEISEAKNDHELQEQLQQLQEMQHDQEAQLQQLQIQFQQLHVQEQSQQQQQQHRLQQPPPLASQQQQHRKQQFLSLPQLQRQHYVQQQQKQYVKNKYRKPYYARTYSPITPKPLHPQVAILLSKVGMSKYKAFFEREEIDFQVFRTLTQKELIKLGIFSFEDRTQLVRAIALAQNIR